MLIITVKQKRNPEHDPHNKKTGPCPWSRKCTDVTGEHHSFVGTDWDVERLKDEGVHITRVEEVEVGDGDGNMHNMQA